MTCVEQASFELSDMAAFWMPFTANLQFKDAPRLLARRRRSLNLRVAGPWCARSGKTQCCNGWPL
ncbi:MAG: hypothetical protein DI523_38100 [Paraburkholderia fungorum]|nr:MAG: hypothetical protein DI523_38100 [Paraburkholderia fungorum]